MPEPEIDPDELEHPDFDDIEDGPRLVADEDLASVILSPEGDPGKLAEYAKLFGTEAPPT